MTHKPYKERKLEFDTQVFSYLMKRIFEDFDESDACNAGIIDGIGNIVKEPDYKSQWTYTMLDQFITMMKQTMGQDTLRDMFADYSHCKDYDPLYMMNDATLSVDMSHIKNIVSIVNDKSYLPAHLYHVDDTFIDEERGLNYSDQISKALTIATFLLYGLRSERCPDRNLFSDAIVGSVESTFNTRAFNDYEKIADFCKKNKLIDSRISNEGIRMIVKIARELVHSNILAKNDHAHNRTALWIKLSKVS
jgi:hypothetical protein